MRLRVLRLKRVDHVSRDASEFCVLAARQCTFKITIRIGPSSQYERVCRIWYGTRENWISRNSESKLSHCPCREHRDVKVAVCAAIARLLWSAERP